MPGILGLNAQMGEEAQSLYDATAMKEANRLASNIQTHAENQSALWDIGGRAVAAGIQTYKDQKKAQEMGPPPTDKSGSSSDKTQNEQPSVGEDFLKNFINPFSKYEMLSHALRGQGVAGAPGQPAQGPISSINHDNASTVSALYQGMYIP